MMTRFIFITGGVVSSLGKGIASASLAALLQERGYKVRLRKLDPYLNIDPGTMSPHQHGEVFVTEDGTETDLDLGHYERFTGVNARKGDNITAGCIYAKLLNKERQGDYLGNTVQVIPHVTDLIKEFILSDLSDEDFVLCEIGGTVGDIEAQPFCEAIRQLRYELGREKTVFIHVTLVPYLNAAKELKTKPTQHSVKELRSIGIQPDILMCRADRKIPQSEKEKIALFCNIPVNSVIEALDQKSIYSAPIAYHEEGLDKQVLAHFSLEDCEEIKLEKWKQIQPDQASSREVTIGIVAKYNKIKDAYKSLIEAIYHAQIFHKITVKIKWINSERINDENIVEKFSDVDAILVPGGFGVRGIEGKIKAIKYARENKIPFLGICLGMQLAVIEFARSVLKIDDAGSSEFTKSCTGVIGLLREWESGDQKEYRGENDNMGGTMRLGAFECLLKAHSKASKVYNGASKISERHRHRYEFNISMKKDFEGKGLNFSGLSPDGLLAEILEIEEHPWFVGVQFHPELKSRPFAPHPLFTSFVNSAINRVSDK